MAAPAGCSAGGCRFQWTFPRQGAKGANRNRIFPVGRFSLLLNFSDFPTNSGTPEQFTKLVKSAARGRTALPVPWRLPRSGEGEPHGTATEEKDRGFSGPDPSTRRPDKPRRPILPATGDRCPPSGRARPAPPLTLRARRALITQTQTAGNAAGRRARPGCAEDAAAAAYWLLRQRKHSGSARPRPPGACPGAPPYRPCAPRHRPARPARRPCAPRAPPLTAPRATLRAPRAALRARAAPLRAPRAAPRAPRAAPARPPAPPLRAPRAAPAPRRRPTRPRAPPCAPRAAPARPAPPLPRPDHLQASVRLRGARLLQSSQPGWSRSPLAKVQGRLRRALGRVWPSCCAEAVGPAQDSEVGVRDVPPLCGLRSDGLPQCSGGTGHAHLFGRRDCHCRPGERVFDRISNSQVYFVLKKESVTSCLLDSHVFSLVSYLENFKTSVT